MYQRYRFHVQNTSAEEDIRDIDAPRRSLLCTALLGKGSLESNSWRSCRFQASLAFHSRIHARCTAFPKRLWDSELRRCNSSLPIQSDRRSPSRLCRPRVQNKPAISLDRWETQHAIFCCRHRRQFRTDLHQSPQGIYKIHNSSFLALSSPSKSNSRRQRNSRNTRRYHFEHRHHAQSRTWMGLELGTSACCSLLLPIRCHMYIRV